LAGAAIAVSDEDGFSTFIGSIPDVLPEGIVSGEQDTPGGKLAATGQVTTTAPVKPPLGVSVIVEFAVVIVPAAPATVVTVTGVVALTVKLGEAALIVNTGGFGLRSGPPPGCGVNRSMNTDAAVVKSESGSFTVIEVAEQAVMFDRTKELKSTTVALAPPQMIDPPLTVSEKFVVPVVVVVGLMVLITGIGFKIVKGTPFVGFSCAGSVTVTVADAPFTS